MGVIQNQNWKKRLYDAYVSSGQASDSDGSPDRAFSSRKPSIQSLIKTHIPPQKSARIVDLGCGHGAYLYFLKLAGYDNVEGIDVSAEQVELAARLGVPEVQHHDLDAYLESAPSSSVNVVLLIDVLEHMTRSELFNTMDEVFRILKPGGRCIAHVPNAEGIFGMRIRYGDLTHEMAFTPRTAEQLFYTIGFETVESHEDRPVIHSLRSLARRIIWDVFTLVPRILLSAETGGRKFVLSQNMLIVADK